MLPVEAQTTDLGALATAADTATVIPRSLKEPVGLAPSSFSQTWQPVSSDRCGAGTSGVSPSPSVTSGSTGSRSR